MKRSFSLLLLLAMAMGVYASDTAQESAKYEKLLLAEWKDSVRHALADAFNAKQMCIGRDTMPLHWRSPLMGMPCLSHFMAVEEPLQN